MTERERDAIDLLYRIYNGKAPEPLHDDGMTVEWIMDEIAAFIRRHGELARLLRDESP